MKLVFGSPQANELLRAMSGTRFDLRDVDPFEPQTIIDQYEPSPYCPICGGYMDWVDCWQCGGKGGRDGDDLMEEDPLWYSQDDWETCDVCRGKGGYHECASLPHDEVGIESTEAPK